MCLQTIWTDEQMNEWLEEQPEIIYAYKAALDTGKHYEPIYNYTCIHYSSGWNNPIINNTPMRKYDKYTPYYHLFILRKEAEKFGKDRRQYGKYKIIECKVHKAEITNVGKEYREEVVVVAKRFWCPVHPSQIPTKQPEKQKQLAGETRILKLLAILLTVIAAILMAGR